MTLLRLADHDWLSAPTDAQPNARFEGLLDPSGVTTIAALGFWAWESGAQQSVSAQVALLDAGGALDSAALSDLSGLPVSLEQVDMHGSLAAAAPVARYVVDRLVTDGDGRKTLLLRDAHDALDKIINAGTFAAGVNGLEGQTQPMSIGAVFNAPVLLTGSDGAVGWLADAPQAVAVLRDRADAMEAGTYSLDTFNQQVLLASPPIGPMTADLSSIGTSAGAAVPATMQQALREVMRRAGITAWSSADAQAIDTASGYAGIGYYASQPVTARVVLAAIASTYGAWYWQDASGVLRLTRLVNPQSLPAALEVTATDISGDLSYTVDTAPGLTARMAWRPNARVMSESDFVTDFSDVPHELRAQLSAPQAGVVTASGAGTLPSEYRHAVDAEPFRSLLWRQADAQAEINRIIALYQTVRRNWQFTLRGVPDLAPAPGQCCLLTYPRHGLDAGRKLLVRRVERNPSTGDLTLTLWG